MCAKFNFKEIHESDIPKYQQLVNQIHEAIANNFLESDNLLPSVNEICSNHKLSKDTVFKAYSILRKSGVIKSVPNKGYYVANSVKKVLLVLDTFKASKEVLYHSFVEALPEDVIVDLQFHHYNIDNFKTIINNSIGKYYKYVVMGFDHLGVSKNLVKIDNQKLLLIDWNIHSKAENNYVFQDFGKSFYAALTEVLDLFKKYQEIHFIYPTYSFHPIETLHYFEKFCAHFKFKHEIIKATKDWKIQKGIAYISVSDTVLGTFLEQCKENNLEPGTDVGFLSYNDTPMKKFIYKGITVVSTDFKQIGISAAKFMNLNCAMQCYVPTKVIVRDSL